MRSVVNRMIYDTATGRYLARANTGDRLETLYISPAWQFFVHRVDQKDGERIVALREDKDLLDWLERNRISPACVEEFIDLPLG